MLVIVKDAEARLLDDLRVCLREKKGQRCYYMGFSKSGVPRKELFETVLKMLQDVPDSYKAQVYICRDKDIFVLMQGFMQRHFEAFLKKLSEALGDKSLQSMADIFELGIHWRKLEAMCQHKIEAVMNEEKSNIQIRQQEKKDECLLKTLENLNPDLLATISARRSGRGRPVVMVVDDDQISRTLVGNVVREKYDCLCSGDGRSALYDYVSNAPDVLFLDIGLPDINGHDVLEGLLQIDPDAYVIMFSGRKDQENIMRALETGAQGFIGKPFTREKLFEYINRSPFIGKVRSPVYSSPDVEHAEA